MSAHFDWFGALAESPIILVLIACSVITLGVVIERTLHYWKRRDDPDKVLREVLERVRASDIRGAAFRCDHTRHPFGAVARRLLQGSDPLSHSSDEMLSVTLSEQKLLLERNLGILGTMAAIAPLIGLLGTVWGIMRAFGDMARVGSAAPSVVASGVAEALVTTAAGLIVAVPALVLYNHFARRANTMLTIAENHARTLRAQLAEFHIAGSERTGETPERESLTVREQPTGVSGTAAAAPPER
jgi:biopolymer transport protein ExbB